jgi:hypothetical protein
MTYRGSLRRFAESYRGALRASGSGWSALSCRPKSRPSQQCAATKLSSVTAIQREKA